MARKSLTPAQQKAKRRFEKEIGIVDPFAPKPRRPGDTGFIGPIRPGGRERAPSGPPALSIDVTAKGEKAPDQPGRFVREGTDIVSGITLPSVGGKPPRTFLGITPADVKQIMESAGLTEEDVPVLSEEARAAAEARARGEEVEEE